MHTTVILVAILTTFVLPNPFDKMTIRTKNDRQCCIFESFVAKLMVGCFYMAIFTRNRTRNRIFKIDSDIPILQKCNEFKPISLQAVKEYFLR